MKSLKTYFECGEVCATPANTMGMGNPGEIGPDILSEPINGIEKTAKSEAEKDKKKRKKKIKSLSESIFDDNIKKDILIGDILELEQWESANITDYPKIDMCFNQTFNSMRIKKLISSQKWKKFLSPYASSYQEQIKKPNNSYQYMENNILVILTWIIMCCNSVNEIKQKLNEFIKHSKNSEDTPFIEEFEYYCYDIEIFPLLGFGNMAGFPRLVSFKLKCKNREYVIYAKFKRKDI